MSRPAKKTLEQVAKAKLRKGEMQDIIIGAIALTGVLVIAATAAPVLKLFKGVDIPSRDPVQRFRERISKLKRKGLLTWTMVHGKYRLELTRKGEEYANQIRMRTIQIKRPRKWDGMWRMIIFDIPETKRNLRDKVRHLLEDLGLYRLQDSVWVHPHDFEQITAILKQDLKVGSEMRYVIAAAIEWDEPLREHFEL